MNKRCMCGHDEADHAADGCSECLCSGYVPDPTIEEEPGYVFD